MKVILQQDVTKVGHEGEIVSVSDGYARNFLFPRSLAVAATGGALKSLQVKLAREEKRAAELKAQADTDAATLEGKTVKIAARTGESDRLYGSITAGDIAETISKSLGVSVDRRKVNLTDPIKALGTYTVPVKLHRDVTVSLTVEVAKTA